VGGVTHPLSTPFYNWFPVQKCAIFLGAAKENPGSTVPSFPSSSNKNLPAQQQACQPVTKDEIVSIL
jgi:hypothetical protein